MLRSKSVALRTGFGIVIGLLAISTFMAWKIQEGFSRRTVEILQQYVHQQETFTNLRRVLWAASVLTRDYFLNPGGDREFTFHQRLDQLQQERDQLLGELENLNQADTSTAFRGTDATELRQRFEQLWIAFHAASKSPDTAAAYAYIQEELVPKRDATGHLLRKLETSNHASLYESQEKLTKTRHAAADLLLVVLGLCLLGGLVVAYGSLRHSESLESENARQFEEVSQAKQELERLSVRLMEIQEQERTRLSRELHDEIVQTLAVLRIEVTQAQLAASPRPGETQERLVRARELVERTIRTARNIMLLLRPSMLDDLGLGPALQYLVEDFQRRTGISCELEEIEIEDDLPEAVKTCVYRVTQEALHNCEKHANAHHVEVRVAQQPDQIQLLVEDDGVGFRVPDHSPARDLHFGLIGMRERAQGLRGSLNIDSQPGKGARVQLILPLSPAATHPDQSLEVHA